MKLLLVPMKEGKNAERKTDIYISQTVSLVNSMLSTLWPATGKSTYREDPSPTISRKVHPGEQSSSCSSCDEKGGIVLKVLA